MSSNDKPQAAAVSAVREPPLIWGDPPMSEVGDGDADPIFTAIGRALTAWEIVETNLAFLFSRFCSGSRGEGVTGVSGRAYGAVPSGNTRRDMLEEVAEMYSRYENDKFDMATFKSVLGHYSNAVRSRNNIAHGVVTEITGADGKHGGWYLTPSPYLTKRNVRVDKWPQGPETGKSGQYPWWSYRYVAADIASFTERYKRLAEIVGRIHNAELQWQVGEMMAKQTRIVSPP